VFCILIGKSLIRIYCIIIIIIIIIVIIINMDVLPVNSRTFFCYFCRFWSQEFWGMLVQKMTQSQTMVSW